MPNATPCQLPPESRLAESLPRMDYLDSFAVPSRTPEQDLVAIYAAALGHLPKVFKHLLVLRSPVVTPLGRAALARAPPRMCRSSCGPAFLWTIFPFHRFGVARLLGPASAAGRI